jgi:hypothetical protein
LHVLPTGSVSLFQLRDIGHAAPRYELPADLKVMEASNEFLTDEPVGK